MARIKYFFTITVVILLIQGCSPDFFENLPEANPADIKICDTCFTLSSVASYEENLGSEILNISGRMKYEWNVGKVSVIMKGDNPTRNERATFEEETKMQIYLRPLSSLEGYNEAVSYFASFDESSTIIAIKYYFYPGNNYFYPINNFFGYYKYEQYQDPNSVIHTKVEMVSPETLLKNYSKVISWLKGLENERYELKQESSFYSGTPNKEISGDWKGGRQFKLEVPWIEDLLFHTYTLYDKNTLYTAVEFKINSHAPLDTYEVYEDGNIYPLYYKLDLENLVFLITIYAKNLPYINFHLPQTP